MKPAVFYGTSITQGGCANNAGGDYPSIVSRALNLDTVNLGFSGCGQGEPEVARMIQEIDASLSRTAFSHVLHLAYAFSPT